MTEKIKRPKQKSENPVPKPRKSRKKAHPKFVERQISIIEKYNLIELIIKLKREKKSYGDISRYIADSGLIPAGVNVSVQMLSNFFTKKLPEIKQELIKGDKRRLLKITNSQIDIMGEVNNLYLRTRNKLLDYEQNPNTKMTPKEYKSLSSEMRELLKQILELQKEVLNFENVKMFMDIVITTVKEVCPDAMPPLMDRLRSHNSTSWMAGKDVEE